MAGRKLSRWLKINPWDKKGPAAFLGNIRRKQYVELSLC